MQEPSNQDFHYSREEVALIIRELNMNMTPEEFNMLSAEIQNDIIQNYYMAGSQRALHQAHQPSSPLQAP